MCCLKEAYFGIFSVFSYHTVFSVNLVIYMYTDYPVFYIYYYSYDLFLALPYYISFTVYIYNPDTSLQAHDHSLKTFIANIAQEHVYCKERPSRTNPFTSLNYFTVPITNIILLPVLTTPVYNFPYNNLSDDCLIDELTPENNAVNEININNPLDFIIGPDHIDYSVLGSIDPDTNFLMGNDTSLCHYITEFEFNQCFPTDDKFSLFNFNIRSFPKISKKCDILWKGYIISLLS